MNELATYLGKLDSNLVQNADGVWCMSSLAIAELTGKEHFHIMRDIKTMLEELEIGESKFGGTYLDVQNKPQPMYSLPKRECYVLVSGYSAKMRAAIVDRWQLLEDAEAERQQAAAERIQAALADEREAHAKEREARAKLQKEYTSLSFKITTGRSSVRADMFDWKRRFAHLTSAYTRKPDEYGFIHTPKDAVDVLAPYAEEAIRLISIALKARMALGTAMVKCGIDTDVVYKVLEEFITYVDKESGR